MRRGIGKDNFKLQTANCKLQTANCKLQNCELQIASCKLQTASCELQKNRRLHRGFLERWAVGSGQFAVCSLKFEA
jgi:hypothetical protein